MAALNCIDDCLSTRDGHLFVEECDAVELIRQFGSPLFVLSEDQIRRNVRRFQEAFQKGWPDGPVMVLPAAKANWIPAVQRILADEGCGCDIYSPGELTVALDAGFDPQFISVNGVPKDEAHIYRSVQAGVRITVDSVEEVEVIERAADELDRVARVRLRLKPPISGFIDHTDFVAEGLVPTDIAAMVYKGGLSFEQIMAVGPRILERFSAFDAIVTNNTFDSNLSGIFYIRWPDCALFATDNLFTGNDEGIGLKWSGDPPHHNYNAFYGNSSNIYDLDGWEVDIGPQSRDLVSSPYDAERTGWDAGWYLKQEADEGENPDEVLGPQRRQLHADRETTLQLRDELRRGGAVKRAGREEEDVVGLDRPVLRADRAALDDGQEIALNSFAGDVWPLLGG